MQTSIFKICISKATQIKQLQYILEPVTQRLNKIYNSRSHQTVTVDFFLYCSQHENKKLVFFSVVNSTDNFFIILFSRREHT